MFWYGIEQLFMDNVLADPNLRAWSTLVYGAMVMLGEIPGGVLADRYGRRKLLIAGVVLQFLGVLCFVLSQSASLYIVGAALYGLYWSCVNGATQALMYDHLHGLGQASTYAKHQGAVYAYGYLGSGIANLLSGVIADHTSLRTSYIISLLPILISFVLVLSLKETNDDSLAKNDKEVVSYRLQPYVQALSSVLKRGGVNAYIFVFQIVLMYIIYATILEFGQIYILHFGVSATQLGVLWAIDAAVVALLVHLSHRLRRKMWIGVSLLVIAMTTLAEIKIALGIVVFMLVYGLVEVVNNLAETGLQHYAVKKTRATMLSSVSFLGHLCSLPFILGFNALQRQDGIMHAFSTASLIAVILLAPTIFLLYKRHTIFSPQVKS